MGPIEVLLWPFPIESPLFPCENPLKICNIPYELLTLNVNQFFLHKKLIAHVGIKLLH